MKPRKICIVGGTGFVGRHLATELTRRGYALKVLTRRRERHRDLLVLPKLELVQVNPYLVSDLTATIGDCDAVVNTTGILNETGTSRFESVHVELPRIVLEACRYHRIGRLLHVSALKASAGGPSDYLKTKWAGEEALRASVREGAGAVAVTVFRPSVVFGPEDQFLNRFASLLRLSPGFFPLAGAETRFQPVYVGDVARGMANALERRETRGQAYDLCGPHVYTLQELVEYAADLIGVPCRVWPLSDRLAELQARVLEHFPGKPLTRDNLRSLEVDSVSEHNGLPELGVTPTGIEAVVPRYLGHDNRTWRYGVMRRLAGRRERMAAGSR